MKMAFISSLSSWMQAHRIIGGILVGVLICGAAAGVWFGWQEYQRRQTAAFAVEKIKKALTPPDADALAHMADFKTLNGDLAHVVAEVFPFFMAGPDQERQISRKLQTRLLEKITEKEQKGSMFPDEASERAKLERPLDLLPPDFLAQFANHLQVRETGASSAIATTSITHPQLQETFTLAMDMRKTDDGWKIRQLANSRELVRQLREAMLRRFAALRHVVLKKNADTARQMNEILPIQSCTADAGALSNGRIVLLVIHAIARNKGDIQINNYNMDAAITDSEGRILVQRLLNAARPVAPGEDFNQRWTMELDASSPLARNLLANAPLQCHASWKTLSLARPKVLHIEEVPHADVNCREPGHNHPAGFCEMPVFQY